MQSRTRNFNSQKETLYLDTSVPSAYYDERAKERMEATIKFWKEVLPRYKSYVSEITVKELANTSGRYTQLP